jgi:hypothetical protein
VVEGRVSGVRPFGVFVDLPEFGTRATGMIPREESGEPRNSDLAAAFPLGKTVRVEILEPRAGKIRLRLEGVTPAAPTTAAAPAAGEAPAPDRSGGAEAPRPRREGGERPRREGGEGGRSRRDSGDGGRGRRGGPGERGRGEGSPRREGGRREGGRGDRSERDERSRPDRGRDRGDYEDRGRDSGRPTIISSKPIEGELTPMAIALRKAMEEAKKKAEGEKS